MICITCDLQLIITKNIQYDVRSIYKPSTYLYIQFQTQTMCLADTSTTNRWHQRTLEFSLFQLYVFICLVRPSVIRLTGAIYEQQETNKRLTLSVVSWIQSGHQCVATRLIWWDEIIVLNVPTDRADKWHQTAQYCDLHCLQKGADKMLYWLIRTHDVGFFSPLLWRYLLQTYNISKYHTLYDVSCLHDVHKDDCNGIVPWQMNEQSVSND